MKEVLPYVAPIVAAFLGWLFGYRKSQADATVSELDAVEKAVGIWRELATSLRSDLEMLRAQCDHLDKTVINLKHENELLKHQVNQLERNIAHK